MERSWDGLLPAPYFDLVEGFYLVEDVHYFIDTDGNTIYTYDGGDNGDGDSDDSDGDGDNGGDGGDNGSYDGDGDGDNGGDGDSDYGYASDDDEFWDDVDPPPPDVVLRPKG